MGVFFWLAIWVFVAAPLALLLYWGLVRMSGDDLPAADPYSSALDPTLLDTDAHRDRQPAEPAAPTQPTLHKTIASGFHFSGASGGTLRAVKTKDSTIDSPRAAGTGTTMKNGRRTA